MFDKYVEIYDIEVAPNLFTYTGISAGQDIDKIESLLSLNVGKDYCVILRENNIPFTQFVIGHGRNDFGALVKHFNRDVIFVGFNNHEYDDLVINYLLMIATSRFNIPTLIVNRKTIATNAKGVTSDVEYNIFRGDKIKSVMDLNYTIYMISQAITQVPFMERSKSKLLKSLKNIVAPYQSIDLFEIMEGQGDDSEGSNERKGLKMLAIMYKWLRIEDLPYKYYEMVEREWVIPILDYNMNDVLITLKSFIVRAKDLKLRKNMMKKYDYGHEILSYNKSALASLFIENDYAKLIHEPVHKFKYLRTIRSSVAMSQCIIDSVKFDDTVEISIDEMVKIEGKQKKQPRLLFEKCTLSHFLKFLKVINVYGTNQIDYVLHFKDISFNFKSGGLHSVDTPRIFRTVQGVIYYKDIDFDSYYPQLRKFGKVCPQHLDPMAFDILATKYVDDRLVYKKAIKTCAVGTPEREDAETGSNSLKIVVNSGLFGKFGSEHSFLCDLKALLTITINGQLILLMLAEKYITAGIKVVNANTDGLICEIREDQLELYYSIGTEFSRYVQIGTEYTHYDIYGCKNVNNYIAVKEGAEDFDYLTAIDKGFIKQKGEFIDVIDPAKGYKHPIVPHAVNKYFIDGTPVEETIRGHCAKGKMNILDFCFAEKINANNFNMELIKPNGDITNLQKTNRAYISTKPSKNGLYGQLYKRRLEPKYTTSPKTGKVSANHGSYFKEMRRCTVINDWFAVDDPEEYAVDYNYYIRLAKENIMTMEKELVAATPARLKKRVKEAMGNESQGTLDF